MAKIKIKIKPSNSPISDNTRVKRIIPTPSDPAPKYTYKKSNFTSKDSVDYKKGFNSALKSEGAKKPNVVNPDRKTKGTLLVVGLNDRYNEGYSEGRDVVLSKKNK